MPQSPMNPRSTWIRRLALATTALVVLAGCGSEEPASTPAPSEPTTDAATTEAAPTSAAPTEAADAEPTGSEASGNATVVAVGDSDLGPILVDDTGITLYVFDNDDVDTSACNDDCLGTWPPVEASVVEAGDGVGGELGTFTRDDGTEQATVNGLPLYYFAADAAPGDLGGQGIGDVWWVVDPSGASVTGSAGEATPTEATYGVEY